MNNSSATEQVGRTDGPSAILRGFDWLRLKLLGDESLPVDAEDPEVIKLMAHQHSYLL